MLHHRRTAPFPDAIVRNMHAARKAVFVDLLGWDVPVLDQRYEVDQFDDGHATYLVLADGERHLASARLLPTTRPYILGSLYPQLCAVKPPLDPKIYEITRFCLDRGLRARERRAVRDTLVCELVDHALANGISEYVAIAEMSWFQQILAFGWDCRPLGLPQSSGGDQLVAFRIVISPETPALLAAAGIAPDMAVADARVAA